MRIFFSVTKFLRLAHSTKNRIENDVFFCLNKKYLTQAFVYNLQRISLPAAYNDKTFELHLQCQTPAKM